MAGDAIGIYGEGLGLPVKETSYFTSLTLASMLVGYVVGLITIPRYLSQERYLAYSAILGIILVAGASLTQGYVSRSEEHTSELQSLMRISYAVFCLKKKKRIITTDACPQQL